MEDQINLELIKLQEELTNLSEAVSHIDKAKEAAVTTVESIKEIQKNYTLTLNKLSSKYEDYLELLKDKADNDLNQIASTHKKHIDQVEMLINQYHSLIEASSKLPEQIEDIDFPVRLDKIDSNITDINKNLLNTQKLVDNLQNGVKLELKKTMELEQKIEQQNKHQKSLKIILIVVSIILAGVLALNLRSIL